jgi:hypothetical protein
MKTPKDNWQVYRELVERALSDPEFRQRLVSDPEAVLGEAGIHLAADERIQVVKDTEKVKHFILPLDETDYIC